MNLIRNLYLRNRFFTFLTGCAVVFVFAFFFPALLILAKFFLAAILIILISDIFILFRIRQAIDLSRECAERFSNGDPNDVQIYLSNHYPFSVSVEIIDELPVQLQIRDFIRTMKLEKGEEKILQYSVTPLKRGSYEFGAVNVFATGLFGFVRRRFRFPLQREVKVYPSFLQMKKYELYAIRNDLANIGIKKIRRLGHTMEFEKIKEYVEGDDTRSINWKATARKNSFMVNQFQDEKSQQVYSIIDKGRQMKMPFEGMSLLDYAINASLVISNLAIRKDDKAGLITFSNEISTVVSAAKKNLQMPLILDALYNEKTGYKESDFQKLHIYLKRKVAQRSLILLFTNFESLASLKRQMKYLKAISRSHLLVVIFFENTELKDLLKKEARETEEIYLKTIAEKFFYEKKLIAKELRSYGIHPIMTSPQNLTVQTINKYLELKSRGML